MLRVDTLIMLDLNYHSNMEKIDISKLREETLKAVEKGEELKRLKMLDDSEKEKNRHNIAKAWAEAQAASVPSLAMEAARTGKNYLVVANTKRNYDAVAQSNNRFLNWNTGGIGLRYFLLEEMLTDAGFEVYVTFQHDGVGIESWYEIQVKW